MTFEFKNGLFLALVMFSNTVGTLFLAIGMHQMPRFVVGSPFPYFVAFLANPWIMVGIAMLAMWMFSQLSMYTWADLSYVLPMTAGAYVLTAILSRFVLHEHISFARWAGILLISFGVFFVAETPPREEEEPQGASQ
ncbi:MAG: EamA family transporter [Acidobacteriaceae bacterium]